MRSPRLELVAVGLDHTTAGVGIREQLAFADSEIPGALQRLTDPATRLLDQAAILSTCNRVELYGVAQSRPAERQLASFLAGSHGLATSEVASLLYVHRGDRVAHHLAATAAGMHSLVLGEVQILGQIRKALDHALTAHTAGAELRRLFESAIAAGRRVRSGTAIGRGIASVPAASVELARRHLGTLDRSTVLLIGTGDMAELASKQLAKRGVKELLVLGRGRAQAERLALPHGGLPITADQLDDALARADVVISAASAPRPIVHRERLRRALADRHPNSLPLLLIDLAVPRNVDPAANELHGVEIHAIDDLRATSERVLRQRRAELPHAEAILTGEVARFTSWLTRRAASAECLGRQLRCGDGTLGVTGDEPGGLTRDHTGAI